MTGPAVPVWCWIASECNRLSIWAPNCSDRNSVWTIVGLGGGHHDFHHGSTPTAASVSIPYWGSRVELMEVIAMARNGQDPCGNIEFPLEQAVASVREAQSGSNHRSRRPYTVRHEEAHGKVRHECTFCERWDCAGRGVAVETRCGDGIACAIAATSGPRDGHSRAWRYFWDAHWQHGRTSAQKIAMFRVDR